MRFIFSAFCYLGPRLYAMAAWAGEELGQVPCDKDVTIVLYAGPVL